MANTWITFIQKWSKDNKVKYNDAMKSPKAKTAYNKSKGKPMAGVAQAKQNREDAAPEE